jgi:hypothetical protein
MDVRLVSPSVWARKVDWIARRPAVTSKSRETAKLAEAVLWTLQDAHIGITPSLAYELARFFKEPHIVEQGVWAGIFRALQDVLPRTDGSGLVAGANPVYTVLKIVKPLVRNACARLGKTCLLADDEIRSSVTAHEYAQYDQALARELKRSTENGVASRLFWTEHGNVVASFSDPMSGTATRASAPEMDRVGLAMLLGLPADTAVTTRIPNRPPAPAFIPKNRPTRGAVEGGVQGVRHTRREADFGSMVLTEFLNPRELLVERLLNSGYVIHERRPRRERQRDVLIAGILPPDLSGRINASFVKACWLDAMARLARLFANARLRDTEFRWLEGDKLGRVRSRSFPLPQLPAEVLSDTRDGPFRDAFLTHLRWLPDYLDGESGYRALEVDGRSSAEDWAGVAWTATNGAPGSSAMEAFSFVHVMVFLPATVTPRGSAQQDANRTGLRGGRERLGRLRATLGIGYHSRRHVSVTYVPDPGPSDWHYGSESDSYLALNAGIAGLSTVLQGTWLAQLTREIWHG